MRCGRELSRISRPRTKKTATSTSRRRSSRSTSRPARERRHSRFPAPDPAWIEQQIQQLPGRQRGGIPAALLGGSRCRRDRPGDGLFRGSVKTHCSRAVGTPGQGPSGKGNSTEELEHLHPRRALDALESRIAYRIAARLSQRADALDGDVAERLRFAREQARSSAPRPPVLAQSRPVVAVTGSGAAVLGGGGWWLKLGSALPILALAAGLFLIQHLHTQAQIEAAPDRRRTARRRPPPPEAYNDGVRRVPQESAGLSNRLGRSSVMERRIPLRTVLGDGVGAWSTACACMPPRRPSCLPAARSRS